MPRINIYLSLSSPINAKQEKFLTQLQYNLKDLGMEPRTLGRTDYDMEAPLRGIRRILNECSGIITLAFQRTLIHDGVNSPETAKQYIIKEQWISSPFCHIEPAMAFQINMPILIFREEGVIADGILEQGVTGTYMPAFSLDHDDSTAYLNSDEFNQLINKWIKEVKAFKKNKSKSN